MDRCCLFGEENPGIPPAVGHARNAYSYVQLYPWISKAKRREYPISTFFNLAATHWTQQERHDPNAEQTSPTFGFVHAFYAIMGGFAFLSECDDQTSAVDESLFTLPVQIRATYEVPSFHGILYIMKHFPHLITNVPEKTILGLAQSDSISKTLMYVQLGWFCVNCASRLFQHLPLSLLEVSTAAHALCTLLTFVVWSSKPLNIPEPIVLRGKEAWEVYALLKCSRGEYEEALEKAQEMVQEQAPEQASETASEKALGTAPGVASGDSSTLIGGKPVNITPAANALLGILQMGRTPEEPPFDRAIHGTVQAFPGSFENNFHKATCRVDSYGRLPDTLRPDTFTGLV